MKWHRHPRVFLHVCLLGATFLFLWAEANALKVCWKNPTHDDNDSALVELDTIELYKDGVQVAQVPATSPGAVQCHIIRLPEGSYEFTATATNGDGRSVHSDPKTLIESRLGGPSGGEVLQGPSGGRVITGEDNG